MTVEETEGRLIRERSPGWRWGMQPEPCLPLPLERKGVVAGTQKRYQTGGHFFLHDH